MKALEEQLADPDFAADYESVTKASQEIAQLHQASEELLMEWTQLSEELEQLENGESDS